jgi:hypothetical protein
MALSDPEFVRRAGAALYGERWLTPLAMALGNVDPRTVRRWAGGQRPVPPGVRARVVAMVRERIAELEELLPIPY